MENYLASLLGSALPLPPWTVALVLVALLLANYYVVRSVRLANKAQHFVAVEDWTPFRRVSQHLCTAQPAPSRPAITLRVTLTRPRGRPDFGVRPSRLASSIDQFVRFLAPAVFFNPAGVGI